MSEPQANLQVTSPQIGVVEVIFERGPPGPPPTVDQINALIDAAIAARFPAILDFSSADNGVLAATIGIL